MKFRLNNVESGTTDLDIESTREIIMYRSTDIRNIDQNGGEIKEEYRDYFKRVPTISKLFKK